MLLSLAKGGDQAVSFTITTNAYGSDKPRTYRVGAGQTAGHSADPLATSGGWYDVTVTASTDSSWSQRFVGHLENGQVSITGV
ncbi:MAG TPA: phospholipase domain-containing protein [Trebonia sp.]